MPGLNFVKQNQPAMQPNNDAISGRLLSVDCFVAGLLAMTSEVAKLLAMMNEVTRFFAMASEVAKLLAMAEGALVIAKRVRHCERSEAIPESKECVHSVLNFTIFFPWMKKNLISIFCSTNEMELFILV